MKKFLSILLAIAMILGISAIPVAAGTVDTAETGDGFMGSYHLSLGERKTIYLSTSVVPNYVWWTANGVSSSILAVEYSPYGSSCTITARDYYDDAIQLNCEVSYWDMMGRTNYLSYTYDIYIDLPQHTVRFDACGGSVDTSSKSVYHSYSIGTMPTPTRSGYTFKGWYYSDGSKADSSDVVNSDITLEAKWARKSAATMYSPPKITNFENVAGGTKITWKNTGAPKYCVFVKTSSGWKAVAKTTKTSYVYKNVKSGVKYSYTVRCMSADGSAYRSLFYKNGWSCTYVAPPRVTGFADTSSGVRVKWAKTPGAVKYRLCVKTQKGWAVVGDTTGLSLLHKGAKNGHTYIYTVRAVSANGSRPHSGFNTTGWKHTYKTKVAAAPKITKISNTVYGPKIIWGKVSGVSKYRVYIKSGSSWKAIGTTTKNYFFHKTAVSGAKSIYTVRGMNASGDFVTAFDKTGKANYYLAAPNYTLSNSAYSVDFKWKAVRGAVRYNIYYLGVDDHKWYLFAWTDGTDFDDEDVDSGTITYAVRAVGANGSMSAFYVKEITRP